MPSRPRRSTPIEPHPSLGLPCLCRPGHPTIGPHNEETTNSTTLMELGANDQAIHQALSAGKNQRPISQRHIKSIQQQNPRS